MREKGLASARGAGEGSRDLLRCAIRHCAGVGSDSMASSPGNCVGSKHTGKPAISGDKRGLSENQNICSAAHKYRLPGVHRLRIIALGRIGDARSAKRSKGVSSTLLLWCGFNAVLPGLRFFCALSPPETSAVAQDEIAARPHARPCAGCGRRAGSALV